MTPYWQNLKLYLDSLTRRGVTFRLSPETGDFQYRDAGGVLSAEEKAGIEICRDSLKSTLRSTSRLCVVCGEDEAQFPNLHGRRRTEEDGKFVFVEMSAPQELLDRHPPLYCSLCWQTNAYLEFAGLEKAKPTPKPVTTTNKNPVPKSGDLFEEAEE